MPETKKTPKVTLIACRFDEATSSKPAYHAVPRNWREDRFCEMLDLIGCSNYGYVESKDHPLASYETKFEDGDTDAHYVIDTPLFTIRPYYWGDSHDIYPLPNFVYKPWDFEIKWYKYPMRDAHANIALTDDDFILMCETCEKFVRKLVNNGGKWPDDDVDDFPRMTEADEAAWHLRKTLDRLIVRNNKLEDLLYMVFERYGSAMEDDKLKHDIQNVLDITDIENEEVDA